MEKSHFKQRAAGTCMLLAMAGVLLTSAASDTDILTREGKTVTVNTTQLSKTVRGFRAQTPVLIRIENGKVKQIEPLKNQETPAYFNKAKALLKQYEGKNVKKAAHLEVDGVSGATFSSKALKKNVELGLKYYQEHK